MPAVIAGFDDMHGISASEFSNPLKTRGTPTQNQHGQWGYETMVFVGNHLAGFMPGTSNPMVVHTYRPEFVALGDSQSNSEDVNQVFRQNATTTIGLYNE